MKSRKIIKDYDIRLEEENYDYYKEEGNYEIDTYIQNSNYDYEDDYDEYYFSQVKYN